MSSIKQALPAPLKDTLKSLRSLLRGSRRLTQRPATLAELTGALAAQGIREGDCVIVHSSLSRLGHVEGGADTVVAAVLNAVGSTGTVLMPVFCSFEEAYERSERGEPIDLRTEPSQTGKVTEVFRRHKFARRSSHPFSSFSAVGPKAEYLCGAHETNAKICHAGSPLARAKELNGKILGLGVDLSPVSFYHVIEDCWDGYPLDTRAPDQPVIHYIDADGNHVERPVAYYSRTISRTRIDHDDGRWILNYLTQYLRDAGVLHEFTFGNGGAFWMDCGELYDALQRLAGRGITIYSTEESARGAHRSPAVV